jgi:hypothetical protein
MVLETEKTPKLAVRCLRCRRPIPLPAAVQNKIRNLEAREADGSQELGSSLFLLWCGVCRKEGLYLFDDVTDIDAMVGPQA